MFKNVAWKETLFLNYLRATVFTAAICLLGAIASLAGDETAPPAGMAFGMILASPLMSPIMLAMLLACFGIFKMMGAFPGMEGVSGFGMGCLSLPMALIADPILWLIHRKKPEWVPVDKPKFMHFVLVILVSLDPRAQA